MTRPRAWLALVPVAAALAFTDSAFAHATLSPPTVLAGTSQLFTLAVPTEKEGTITTTQIELTPPEGFTIDALVPAPGWEFKSDKSGSGEDVAIRKATWSGGNLPTGEAAVFQFVGEAGSEQTYAFKVRQTYADGSVTDWSGAADSDTPSPIVEAKASLDGGSSTLAVVAFVIATLALVLGAIALLLRAGGRELA